MVFRATTNHTGENGDKKQNTLPYTLQVKVVEVCLVGAGDESRDEQAVPKRKRPTRDVCLFGAGERARNRHTARGIKTHIFTRFLAIFWHFCVIFYPFSNHL